MGNQNNNFSNKSQQLCWYHTLSHNPNTSLTYLTHKHTNFPHILKTITTDSQQLCKQIKRTSLKKVNHKQVPITELVHAFLEQNEELCGGTYQIGLIFEVGERTLKEEIEMRKGRLFEEREIMQLMRKLVMALSFFKQMQQKHEMLSLSNIFFKQGKFVLSDPWISEQNEVCWSPERLDARKNNGKAEYDWFVSDLYSVGMVTLETYYQRSMGYLCDGKKIDEERLRLEVKSIKYREVQKLVRELLGPPRLRIQALSTLLSFSSTSSVIPPSNILSSPLKPHNLPKQLNKKQNKQQMKRQLKQAKQQVKKMIQSNSTRQMIQQPAYKIQTKTRIDNDFRSRQKRDVSQCRSISKDVNRIRVNTSQQKPQVIVNSIYNYNSHIHIHPPVQQIKHYTTINLKVNEHHSSPQQPPDSPLKSSSRVHSHTRSNSGLLYFPTNSTTYFKPSTGSTYHIRSNSNTSNMQEFNNVTIREEQSKEYSREYEIREPYTTPFNTYKDNNTKGVLNTTVSQHNLSANNNPSICSLSNSISGSRQFQNNQFNNILVQDYMKQYSSVIHLSNIDLLNINSSMISSHNSSHNISNHTIVNMKQKSSHSRSNSNLSNHSASSSNSYFKPHKQINIITPTQQPYINKIHKSIINRGDDIEHSSLLYSQSRSKSMSRTMSNLNQQQSQNSFDLPMMKMESVISRHSSGNMTESQLLASQFTQGTSQSNNQVGQQINNKVATPKYQYQGKLVNNLKQGQGKLFTSSGKLIYQGQWRNNQYQGYGKLINQNITFEQIKYKDLDLKRGTWVNYEGSFVKGEMYGFGKIVFCSGQVYEGEFSEGEISGFGQFFDEMDDVVDGLWKGGKLVRVI